MNTAKLTNSVLTGGGLNESQHLNVIIGSSNNGYPKGYVLDANATKQLVGTGGGGSGTQEPSELEKLLLIEDFTKYENSTPYKYKNVILNSKDGEAFSNISLYNIYSGFSDFKNEINGLANINSGYANTVYGASNITLGSGIANTNNSSVLSSAYGRINIVKNTDNEKLRIKCDEGGLVEQLLKDNLLMITDRYAFKKEGSEYIIKKLHDGDQILRNTDDYTRVNNTTIEFNNPNLNKLKDYDQCLSYGVYNRAKSSIIFGRFIRNLGSDYSISVGSNLAVDKKHDNKYPNSTSLFGKFNHVSNDGELACGIFNKTTSSNNGNVLTRFSVGSGKDIDNRCNALEVALFKQTDQTYKDKLYINGIGGYNGSNIEDISVKSIQEVITDLSSNSTTPSTTSFEAADNILKCINSKTSINSNTKIEDVIKDAFKKGWKNIVLKVTFTKDNIWIVSNQELFSNGSENKTPIELTFSEIDNSNNNFIKLEDACKLIRYYGMHTYFIINNYYAKNKYVKEGSLYNNRPYVHKFVETLNICGLSKKYSILSKDYKALIQVISVDALAKVGLIYTTKLDQGGVIDELTVQMMDEINIARGANVTNSVPEISFFSCSFDNVKDLSARVAIMLTRKHFELQVNDFDQNTNIQDVKNMSPYITSALCNDVHIGQKLLESNV